MKTLEAAVWKWEGILSHFGVEDCYLKNTHGPCPLCGGKDRFRFDNKDGQGTYFCSQCGAGTGMKLLMNIKGWDFKTAAKEVDQVIGNIDSAPKKTMVSSFRWLHESIAKKIQPAGDSVRQYLSGRGLRASKEIKQCRHSYFEDGRRLADYDCMICPVTSVDGEIQTYHVTYLENGEKAPVRDPKKLMPTSGELRSAAIRLTKIYEHIGVAEGVETALAVMDLFQIPCWAVVNTSLMEKWLPPEGVNAVTVFADNDANFAGQKSAYSLAHSLGIRGISVEVEVPKNKGSDFADLIKQEAAA